MREQFDAARLAIASKIKSSVDDLLRSVSFKDTRDEFIKDLTFVEKHQVNSICSKILYGKLDKAKNELDATSSNRDAIINSEKFQKALSERVLNSLKIGNTEKVVACYRFMEEIGLKDKVLIPTEKLSDAIERGLGYCFRHEKLKKVRSIINPKLFLKIRMLA